MTPITEDQVLSLMKGLETREKNALKRLARSVDHPDTGGRMTARVLKYTSAEAGEPKVHENNAKPVALDQVRTARKVGRTLQGQFFYSLGAG